MEAWPVIVCIVAALAGALAAYLYSLLTDSRRAHAVDKKELDGARGQLDERLKEVTRLRAENEDRGGQLAQMKQDLQTRPKHTTQTYKIVTIGIPGTGKTGLTKKWAQPTFALGKLRQTEYDSYRRSVSLVHNASAQTATSYDFEILDWGGEHIVKARDQIATEEVHGMLFVVDLGKQGSTEIDDARVALQHQEFQPQVLRYFFESELVTKHCKTVVLFINKSDLARGTPKDVETLAREKYQTLIADMTKYASPPPAATPTTPPPKAGAQAKVATATAAPARTIGRIDLHVLVGSAISGHNTHELFGHFIQKILPDDSYDDNVFQAPEDDAHGRAG